MNEIGSAYIEQGWQCPICKAVMSPKERVCVNCKGKDKDVAVTWGKFDANDSGTSIYNPSQSISYTDVYLNSLDNEFNDIITDLKDVKIYREI